MLDAITSRRTLYEAFARVRENGGCRGADGVTLHDFAANLEAELDRLQDRLLRRRYHPFPLLRFEVPKDEHRVRLPLRPHRPRPLLLRRESMKRYFAAWEEQLTTPLSGDGEPLSFRHLFRRQAERLARALTEDQPTSPTSCHVDRRLLRYT